jgi:hypothetical protein
VADSRQVIVWRPPHERPDFIEAERKKAALRAAREAQNELIKAKSEGHTMQLRMVTAARTLITLQFEKLLKLARHPDFENAPGPLDTKDLVKLAKFVSDDYRLSHGLATENIAHTIAPTIDFEKLTQEERDAWRALAVKGGADE